MITNKMDRSKLRVILKYKNSVIKYSYKSGKKRRFYLQYTNTRNISKLFDYLNKEILSHNYEYCHCFEIIKGKNIFNEMYGALCINELKVINKYYINNKIEKLKKKIKNNKVNITISSIAQYKNNYQSITFEWIYEYVSIIRLILIKYNYKIKYLNLFDIFNIQDNKEIVNKDIFINIYEYMWNLEKLTVYCYENNINYGLHNSDIINYSTCQLDESLNKLKRLILNDLERLSEIYE